MKNKQIHEPTHIIDTSPPQSFDDFYKIREDSKQTLRILTRAGEILSGQVFPFGYDQIAAWREDHREHRNPAIDYLTVVEANLVGKLPEAETQYVIIDSARRLLYGIKRNHPQIVEILKNIVEV